MKKLTFFCSLIFCTGIFYAQENDTEIFGQVHSESEGNISDAYLYLKNQSTYTTTDADGNYRLKLNPGNHELVISVLGYAEVTRSIQIKSGEQKEINFTLSQDEGMNLEDVFINVKSKLSQVKESSFNVVALDAESLHNTSLDISESLDKVSGVRVRRTGGTGSDYNVLLNGFSGKHVKFFIDGVPMEGFNAAFQLNNIPVN
ncbi:MAG TPA: TonB-dependent receptor, partial [Flavobacteriaceae bacterium]|nr:TonB-dependent receptor [Flavobacteriaceae bacterium]